MSAALPVALLKVGTDGRWRRNPISALSRWKIFDNLRRSFVPIALVLFLFGCWLLIPRLATQNQQLLCFFSC